VCRIETHHITAAALVLHLTAKQRQSFKGQQILKIFVVPLHINYRSTKTNRIFATAHQAPGTFSGLKIYQHAVAGGHPAGELIQTRSWIWESLSGGKERDESRGKGRGKRNDRKEKEKKPAGPNI